MGEVRARTHFLDMMRRGKKPYGVFISSTDPTVTEIMGEAGFDYVVLDGEHGRNDRTQVENHVRAAVASGIIPFVRILENSQPLIQATLDVGAQGVIVPHVDTADDARRAVAASYYSPRGTRGICPASYAGSYSLKGWIGKTLNADDNVMVIPIIESKKSVDNIDSILAVDGIDVVHFGPGDLSADMALDLNSQAHELMDAWHKVRESARALGKYTLAPAGFGFEGADMLIEQMDYMLLATLAEKMVTQHKESLGSVR